MSPLVARGAASGPVTGAVFKTVCGAVIPSWVGSTPMSLRHVFAGTFAKQTHGALAYRAARTAMTSDSLLTFLLGTGMVSTYLPTDDGEGHVPSSGVRR